MGIHNFRLEFTNEPDEMIVDAIKVYQQVLETGSLDRGWLESYKNQDDYTKGHYHRGVQ